MRHLSLCAVEYNKSTLGGELTNVNDLVCNLIRSGVTANSLEALLMAPLLVPHLASEPILLPTLLQELI